MNKSLVWLLLMSLGWVMLSQAGTIHDASSRHGVHGMVLFGGSGTYYISHLPLFHHPHDMQIIAQVRFSKANEAAIDTLLDSSSLVTLVPKPFDLNRISEDGFVFHGDLYNGHFERGGTLKIESLQISIEHIIEKSLLKNNKPQQTVTYRLIPNDTSQTLRFYFRVIDSRPAADHIIAVRSQQVLPAKLSFPGNKLHGELDTIAEQLKLPVSKISQIYLEINELQ
ncbi:hypothetical protein [Marinicella sp. W31]|uniref:hypothetical protein n=1 Tax=Marinicella sp. W31 TaxID=3023713 RepID=UPI003757560F